MAENRPSIKDVAARAGVAVGTVSNVLNRPDIVAERTRQTVLDAIEQLGFSRNEVARQLRSGSSTSIAMVVMDVSNPFFTDLYAGAEQHALEQGYSIQLSNSGNRPERESAHLAVFEQQRVRGILLVPTDNARDNIARLREHGIPTVLVDRVMNDEDACSVSVDDLTGGRLAMEHLIASGHRRIAFVGALTTLRQVRDRLAGAREALASTDTPVDFVEFATDGLDAHSGRAAAEQIVRLPTSKRPSAVFAANDMVALGVLQGFVLAGIRVPDDIALVGYDDIDFAASAAVPLSSVRQPRHDMGFAAAELLFRERADRDDGIQHEHRHVRFTPELIVRDSSARPARSS